MRYVTDELLELLASVKGDDFSRELAVILSDCWATYVEDHDTVGILETRALLNSCIESCTNLGCPDLAGVAFIILSNRSYRDHIILWANNVMTMYNTHDRDLIEPAPLKIS